MQMVFQRGAFTGPAARTPPKRGTFALEPVEALPRVADRVKRLAERALETNPFFLPEFLQPAIQGIGTKALRLALFSDRDDMHFFAPVVVHGGGILGGRAFTVWAHPYAPLGTPLIDRASAAQVTDSLLAHMRTSRRSVFSVPHLPLNSLTAEALRAAAERSGYATVAEEQMRPVLYPNIAGGMAEFDTMVSQKRRRELDRQMRRLCETGSVSFMSTKTATEVEAAFNMFIALEAAGWKGRRGTALARRQAVHEFARIAVTQLAQSGLATIDVLRVGEKPIAALIRLEHAGTSIPWKVAFDEEFSAFSPGKQLMCDETRRWLADPSIVRVDPVCEEDNPLMAPLWPEREPYGTLLIGSRKWSIGARWQAGFANLKRAGKAGVKQLVGRRKAPAKRSKTASGSPPEK